MAYQDSSNSSKNSESTDSEVRTDSTEPAKAQLTVATWNLLNFIEPPSAAYELDNILSATQWKKKCDWIDRYLEENLPDVIGFQEIFSADALARQLAPHGYQLEVVDAPRCRHDYIFDSPVVGIASRYPVTSVKPFKPSSALIKQLGLSAQFSFSRVPVIAEVEHPQFGLITFIVVHFKSRRPALTNVEIEAELTQKPAANQATKPSSSATNSAINKSLKAAVDHQFTVGDLASKIQRASEALFIHDYVATTQYRQLDSGSQTVTPVVVLGDFNEPLASDTLRCLSASSALTDSWDLYRQLGVRELGTEADDECDTEALALNEASFNEVSTYLDDLVRPPTHYYGAKGSVLDYIMVNSAFDHAEASSIASVTQYECYDAHLINPIYALDSESTDHAIVKVTLAQ